MARNACGLVLVAALALSGCSKLDRLPFRDSLSSLPFVGNMLANKKAKAAEVKAAVVRARADSLRKARRVADSLAVIQHAACVDSVRAELTKQAVATRKARAKGKKPAAQPSPELIATQAQTVCEQRTVPQPKVAAKPAQRGDSGKAAPTTAKDTAARIAPRDTAARAATKDTAVRTAAKTPTARADSTMQRATDQSAWADSVRKAKEMEMSRETFAYSGGTRDPFTSLLNLAKSGPEVADLQLVGIYRNLRLPSGSVAVFREREGGKRHRLRAGDQLGRSRLVEIRERHVVFMIEDFGFERQETLSLRKQEDVTP